MNRQRSTAVSRQIKSFNDNLVKKNLVVKSVAGSPKQIKKTKGRPTVRDDFGGAF